MVRRHTIWDEIRRMQEQIDRLMEGFFSWPSEVFWRPSMPLLEAPSFTNREIVPSDYRKPLVDVYETDKELVTTVELPGIDKNDIDVRITENGLEIKAEKKLELREEDKKQGIYRHERTYSGFYRNIPLPDGVDTSKVQATYKNGVLEVRVPKTKKKEKKGIEVKVK